MEESKIPFLVRRLVAHFERRVLLTATPHNVTMTLGAGALAKRLWVVDANQLARPG